MIGLGRATFALLMPSEQHVVGFERFADRTIELKAVSSRWRAKPPP